MTEPVAYWHIPKLENDEPFVSFETSASNIFENIPLYTSEQLQPRVKMTQKQYDIIITCLANNISFYTFYGENVLEKELFANLTETDVLEAWLNPWSIEIVADMKWFVRSKEKNGDRYLYLKKPDGFVTPWYTVFKDLARNFDTEEEAELWNNPQTEAVQLPVEE